MASLSLSPTRNFIMPNLNVLFEQGEYFYQGSSLSSDYCELRPLAWTGWLAFQQLQLQGAESTHPSNRHGLCLPPPMGASAGRPTGAVSDRVLTSHILLSLHGCTRDLESLCMPVFIPFAGMAGGCSNFSFSFFFFTFLGCRGDMLVTLVTVSPELQSRDPYVKKSEGNGGKDSLSQWVHANVAPSTCEGPCSKTCILTWGYTEKPLTGAGNALGLFQPYSLAEKLGSMICPGTENAKCQV